MYWINLIAACIIPLIFLYFALESPVYLEIDKKSIALRKLSGRFAIDYDRITNVECYKPDSSEIRLLGSGGCFGYLGKYKNATIGTYQSYVGNYSDSFLIKTKENKNYVFSCENRDLAINTIKTYIKS
jgi:hypothetical protein